MKPSRKPLKEAPKTPAQPGAEEVVFFTKKPDSMNDSPTISEKTAPDTSTPEIVQTAPANRRQLTPEEMRRRDIAKQNIRRHGSDGIVTIAREVGGASQPAAVSIRTAAAGVVMLPANPHLEIFREFTSGQITLEEMVNAIDADVCADEKQLKGFEYVTPPHKPAELIKAELEVISKTHPDELPDALAQLRRKLSEHLPAVSEYVKTCHKIDAMNKSNAYFLKEMYARQKMRRIYADRILASLATHEVEYAA